MTHELQCKLTTTTVTVVLVIEAHSFTEHKSSCLQSNTAYHTELLQEFSFPRHSHELTVCGCSPQQIVSQRVTLDEPAGHAASQQELTPFHIKLTD